MNKTLIRFVAVLGIALVATMPAFAAKGARGAKADKPAKPAAPQVSGKIETVDAQAGTITVDTKTIKVTADTKIATAANPTATLADLKVGDEVLVVYSDDNGTLTAKKIGPATPGAEKVRGKKKGGQ